MLCTQYRNAARVTTITNELLDRFLLWGYIGVNEVNQGFEVKLAKANSGSVWTRSFEVNSSYTEEQMRYGTPGNATHLVSWENEDGSQSGSYFVEVIGEVSGDLLGFCRQQLGDSAIVAVDSVGNAAVSVA